DHRERCALADSRDAEAGRRRGDAVAVTHPDLMPLALLPQSIEQGAALADFEESAAEFAVMAAFHLSAELRRHRHLAIADAEHRHVHFEHVLRRARRAHLSD